MPEDTHPTSKDLDAVIQFVNTVHFEQGEVDEQLNSPAALSAFFADHGLAKIDAKPADFRRALELREALRAVMLANNGGEPDPAAIETLNRAAARAKVVAAFDDHASWRVQPASDGIDGAFGQMIASVFRSMSDGSWERIKACGNPDCRWAFYDNSKNHSGRWCEMASCGNRMKARAFRERARKQTVGDAPGSAPQ
jgi:predicted RNA-binding Zn ribbon-like protein